MELFIRIVLGGVQVLERNYAKDILVFPETFKATVILKITGDLF